MKRNVLASWVVVGTILGGCAGVEGTRPARGAEGRVQPSEQLQRPALAGESAGLPRSSRMLRATEPGGAPVGSGAGATTQPAIAHAATANTPLPSGAGPGAKGSAVEPLPSVPAAPPSRVEQLKAFVAAELQRSEWAGLGVSAVAQLIGEKEPLVAVAPEVQRGLASNAKLLTTTAAAKLLKGGFRTEILQHGGRVYLRGSGDPLLSETELIRLARQAKAKGLVRVTEVIVDDYHFSGRRLAPGFEAFLAGAPYRPTCGAVNVGGNAVRITVSAPANRRRPRVDVEPPSDYVRVSKRVRYRRGRGKRLKRIVVRMKPRGSLLWLTIGGTIGRKASPYHVWRAVYDPGLNAAWALRRALKNAGVRVRGTVRRGATPARARRLSALGRSLDAVLLATNRHSDNLAAEILLRTIGLVGRGKRSSRGSWERGLARTREYLHSLGVRDFVLKNGSGLHRGSRISAHAMVRLLSALYRDPALRQRLLPTLSVAGRSGTLRGRLRGTAAEGVLRGKTGTLGGVLALSGFILPAGDAAQPLAFSILVNGSGRRVVRERIDQVAAALARYRLGLPIDDAPPPQTAPSSGALSSGEPPAR